MSKSKKLKKTNECGTPIEANLFLKKIQKQAKEWCCHTDLLS